MKSKGGYVNRSVPNETTNKLIGSDDVKVSICLVMLYNLVTRY